jgi:hypothetical protein
VVSALTPGSATVMACAGTICGSTTASVVAPDPFLSGVSPNSGPMGSAVVISGQGFGTIQGSSTDLTGVFCTSRGEREFTRRTAGNAQQEIQSGTDRSVAAAD